MKEKELAKVSDGNRVQTEICEDSRVFALKPHEVQNLPFSRWEMIAWAGQGRGRVERALGGISILFMSRYQ